ncbi:hypothetical protein QAD02_013513 [Eretmocerus hayati]|uniref:Uncharacterized protein n=1 Tax=Eretmocerus hayati TaxID=131215 RepID=A0ACC2P4I2_9HYME|nr:hypothetical protein QAD02_013513 [Eretmocerus hayati]
METSENLCAGNLQSHKAREDDYSNFSFLEVSLNTTNYSDNTAWLHASDNSFIYDVQLPEDNLVAIENLDTNNIIRMDREPRNLDLIMSQSFVNSYSQRCDKAPHTNFEISSLSCCNGLQNQGPQGDHGMQPFQFPTTNNSNNSCHDIEQDETPGLSGDQRTTNNSSNTCHDAEEMQIEACHEMQEGRDSSFSNDVDSNTDDSCTQALTKSTPKKTPRGKAPAQLQTEHPVKSCYKPNNDTIIKTVCEKYNIDEIEEENFEEVTDKRGSWTRKDTVEMNEKIQEHVMKFEPSISHYRRENSPFRLYLSSDLSRVLLFNGFRDEYPTFRCSYEKYRRVFKSMNIAFTELGNEECEQCQLFKLHPHDDEHLDPSCTLCCEWEDHINRANEARDKYRRQVQESYVMGDTAFYSADLEKVTYLPRMDCFKSALHCPRVHAFNQTFAPLGNRREEAPVFACVWHDGIAGRKKEEIMSAFHQFFLYHRDKKKIVLWLDNCGGLNKNWALFSSLVYMPGHTFMSADSFHADVERKMKKSGKVCDFTDFVSSVEKASSHLSLKIMDIHNFHDWQDHHSSVKFEKSLPKPYLCSIKHIQARRGDDCLYYRTSHDEMMPYLQMNFLKTAVMKNNIPLPNKRTECQDIEKANKDEILKRVVPLMHESRRSFFINLHVKN